MKKIFVLLLFANCVFALDDISIPNTFSDSGIIYASDHNENFDSLKIPINRLNDTLDASFMRFSDLNDGDTTLDTLKVDYIRSNPDIDSVQGNPYFDSVDINYAEIDTQTTNVLDLRRMTTIDNPYIDVTQNAGAYGYVKFRFDNSETIQSPHGELVWQADTSFIFSPLYGLNVLVVKHDGITASKKITINDTLISAAYTKIGTGGSVIDSIAIIDGAADTLVFKIGGKAFKFLPVANL